MHRRAGLHPEQGAVLTPRALAEQRFDALYRETFRYVYAYCHRRVDQRDAVDDVVAEVYASVWRRLDDALDAEIPLAWIYGIAYRTIGNHRRGRHRARRLVDRLQDTHRADVPPDPALAVERAEAAAELTDELRDALAALNPVDREIVLLSAWENLSQAEIAAVVGVKPASVRSRLYRSRQRLEQALRARDITKDPDTSTTDDQRGKRQAGRNKDGSS